MDLVALLPWWVGIVLAVASYFILHRMAGTSVPAVTQPGQLSAMMTGMLVGTFATAGQYLLPLIFVAGAATSFFTHREMAELHC
jgi:restriction system protein